MTGKFPSDDGRSAVNPPCLASYVIWGENAKRLRVKLGIPHVINLW